MALGVKIGVNGLSRREQRDLVPVIDAARSTGENYGVQHVLVCKSYAP